MKITVTSGLTRQHPHIEYFQIASNLVLEETISPETENDVIEYTKKLQKTANHLVYDDLNRKYEFYLKNDTVLPPVQLAKKNSAAQPKTQTAQPASPPVATQAQPQPSAYSVIPNKTDHEAIADILRRAILSGTMNEKTVEFINSLLEGYNKYQKFTDNQIARMYEKNEKYPKYPPMINQAATAAACVPPTPQEPDGDLPF